MLRWCGGVFNSGVVLMLVDGDGDMVKRDKMIVIAVSGIAWLKLPMVVRMLAVL